MARNGRVFERTELGDEEQALLESQPQNAGGLFMKAMLSTILVAMVVAPISCFTLSRKEAFRNNAGNSYLTSLAKTNSPKFKSKKFTKSVDKMFQDLLEGDPDAQDVGALLVDSWGACEGIAAMYAGPLLPEATLGCTGLPVAGVLVSSLFSESQSNSSKLDAVLRQVDSKVSELAHHFDKKISELKDIMVHGFTKLSQELQASNAKEDMDEIEDNLATITQQYNSLVQNQDIKISWRNVDGYDDMLASVRPSEFHDYLEDILKSQPNKDISQLQVVAKAVPRFLRARYQLLALYSAQCVKTHDCPVHNIKMQVKDLNEDIRAYQKKLQHQLCAKNISDKHLADLSARCFNFPELHNQDQYSRLRGDLKDLPAEVVRLDFHTNELITGDLSSLCRLNQLEQVDFAWNKDITGDLSSLECLERLKLVNFHSNQQITGDLKSFRSLEHLKELNFDANEEITGQLSSLQGLKQLKLVAFASSKKITGDLSSFEGLKQLEAANFSKAEITGDLRSLRGLKQLRCVEFTKITGDLKSLTNLMQLEKVCLGKSEEISGDSSALERLKQLRVLDLPMADKTTGDLKAFEGLKQLEHLVFGGNIKGDLRSLDGLKQLRVVSFPASTTITGNLRYFEGMSQLKEVDFYSDKQITGNLSSLRSLKQLKSLDFTSSKNITGDLRFLQGLKHLEFVSFRDTKNITGNLNALQGLKQLKHVDFLMSEIDGADMWECIKFHESHKHLDFLAINGSIRVQGWQWYEVLLAIVLAIVGVILLILGIVCCIVCAAVASVVWCVVCVVSAVVSAVVAVCHLIHL